MSPQIRGHRRRLIQLIASGVIIGFFGGCIAAIHQNIVEGLPTYRQTADAWPALKYGEGRVVIIYPRLPMGGIAPTPSGLMGDMSVVRFEIDRMHVGAVLDQTFVFMPLNVGRHSLLVHNPGMLGQDEKLEFEIVKGQTTYIEIVARQFKKGPPVVLDEQAALTGLADLHHVYKKPVPFHQAGQYGAEL